MSNIYRILVGCFAGLLICNSAWGDEPPQPESPAAEIAQAVNNGVAVEQFSKLQNARIELIEGNIQLLDEIEQDKEFNAGKCLNPQNTEPTRKCETYKAVKNSIALNLKSLEAETSTINGLVVKRAEHELKKASATLKAGQKEIPSFRDTFLISLLVFSLLVCFVEFSVHIIRILKLGVKDLKDKLKLANEQIESIQSELEDAKLKIEELEQAASTQGFARLAGVAAVGSQVDKSSAMASVVQSSLTLLGKFTISTPWYGPIMLFISLLFYVVTVGGVKI